MDAFVPAFIVALIAQFSDRAPLLAAVLSDRHRSPRAVFSGFLFAHIIGFAIVAAAGALVAPILTPNARSLFLAMALLFGAVGMAWRPGRLDRLDGWRIGGFATALLGAFILAFGDRTQFLGFAIAAWGPSPLLTAIGATLGAMVSIGVAISMGESGWSRLPHRPVRYASAAVFALFGVWIALAAWRLI